MQAPRGVGFLGKRKERDCYYPYPSVSSSSEQAALLQRQPPPFARPDPRSVKLDRPAVKFGAKPPLPQPGAQVGGNKLLAGYLAHEFLRCGTLLGERRLDPPRLKDKDPAAPAPAPAPMPEPSRRYAEVSRLLMAGGARVPGVVNPSQLGRWLRIKE